MNSPSAPADVVVIHRKLEHQATSGFTFTLILLNVKKEILKLLVSKNLIVRAPPTSPTTDSHVSSHVNLLAAWTMGLSQYLLIWKHASSRA